MSISPGLRQQVAEQARYCCGYCLTQERISGIPLTIEHLLPKAKGGQDNLENLWLSCRLCNEAKGVLTEVLDPESGLLVSLFNPRSQSWTEHFAWDATGIQIIGQTDIGRATVMALNLNSEFRLRTRAIWVEAGWHPPNDN